VTDKTIVRKIFVSMTLNAKAHFKLCRRNHAIHLCDITVALTAVKTGLNMRLVAKIDKIRQIRDTLPLHRLTLVVMPAKVGNFWVMNNYFAVAKHTRFKRWNSGMVGIDNTGMTHDAAKFLVGRMNAMTKGDGLFHGGIYCAYRIEDKKRTDGANKQHQQQYRKTTSDTAMFIFDRRQ
jgi:hypothetical protein